MRKSEQYSDHKTVTLKQSTMTTKENKIYIMGNSFIEDTVSSTMDTILEITKTPELYWDDELEAIVDEPCSYVSRNHQGKQFRSLLIQSFNQVYYHLDDSIIEMLSKVAERLHNASLVIDDIEDDSKVRRGLMTSHLVYGVAGSLNSANYSYFLALQELIQFELRNSNSAPEQNQQLEVSPRFNKIVQVFNQELINLHRGQGLDIYWRDYRDKGDLSTIPSEKDYIKMIRNKTGGLFRLMIKLMDCYCPSSSKLPIDTSQLCDLLGLIYQIRDDYLNLVADSDVAINKGEFAEDITEGKFSFPLIHGIQNELSETPNHSQIYDILLMKTQDIDKKLLVLSVLEKYKVLETTKSTIRELGDLVTKRYLQEDQNARPLQKVIQKLMNI